MKCFKNVKYNIEIKKKKKERKTSENLMNITCQIYMAHNDKKIIMISTSVLKLLPSFSHAGSMKHASVVSDPFFLSSKSVMSFLYSKISKLNKHEVI
jgi:hypothetical protein